jgi:hypothetical protein
MRPRHSTDAAVPATAALVAAIATGFAAWSPVLELWDSDEAKACLSSYNVLRLNQCLQQFVVPQGSFTEADWREVGFPTPAEADLARLVKQMARAGNATV